MLNFELNYHNITFWLGVGIAYWFARKKELPSPNVTILVGALIGRIVGSLVDGFGYALLHLHWLNSGPAEYDQTFLDLFFAGSGMGGLTSLAGGGLACIIFWQITKRPIREYQAAVIPALALATAFSRLSCWLTVDYDMGPPAPFSIPPFTAIGTEGARFYTHEIPLWSLPLLEALVYLGYAERSRKLDFLNSLLFFLAFYSIINFIFEFFTWSPPLFISYAEFFNYAPRNAEDILSHQWTGLTYKQMLSLIIGLPSLFAFIGWRKKRAHVA